MYLMQETNKKNFSIWLSFMSEKVYSVYCVYMILIQGFDLYLMIITSNHEFSYPGFVNNLKSIHLVWRVIVFKIIYEKRKENV